MHKNKILLMGKSGSGKTTAADILESSGFKVLKSYTERPKRNENNTDHTYITKEEMDKLYDKPNVICKTCFSGNRYFATIEQLRDADIYIVDPTAVTEMPRDVFNEMTVLVVYLDADEKVCRARMKERGDSEEEIDKRVANDKVSFKNAIYVADVTFDVNSRTPEEVAAVLEELILPDEVIKNVFA